MILSYSTCLLEKSEIVSHSIGSYSLRPLTISNQLPLSMQLSNPSPYQQVTYLTFLRLNFFLWKIAIGIGFTSKITFSSVQSLSCAQLFVTLWTAACQASLSITNSQNLLKLMSTELVMPSNHLILWRPLLSPSIFPSIRVYSNESAFHIKWLKYWSFSFSISPSNEHPGLISFRMDWLDLLAGQRTLKSLLQHHSSKPSILQRSDFIIVQLSYPYLTIGKTIALTRQTFVDKVMSQCFLDWS